MFGFKNNAFGMVMPERIFSNEKYRWGFNGKETDNEVNGAGNSLDFGARIYDSRLGRFLSLDPLAKGYPSYSGYSAMNNNPMLFVDPTGKGAEISNIKVDANTQTGTADLIMYVNLYLDPNITYNGNLQDDISSSLGNQSTDGSWTISAGEGPMNMQVEGIGRVALKVNAKVVVSVITYEKAQEKIETETSSANNYYKIVDFGNVEGGHNMDGTNQGVIYQGAICSNIFDVVLIHEPFHGVANGYPSSGYTTKKPNTYGGHNTSGAMGPNPQPGDRLTTSDFDAVKPNYPYTQQGAPQSPASLRKGDEKSIVGGPVNNQTDLPNNVLSGGRVP